MSASWFETFLQQENARVEWHEPHPALAEDGSEKHADVRLSVSATDCVGMARAAFAQRRPGEPFPSTTDLLGDFLAVHWAVPDRELRHFLVTLHPADADDETLYVLAGTAEDAEKMAVYHVKKALEADDPEDDREVYPTMVVELSGPPVCIHTEYLSIEHPAPIPQPQ